MIVDSINYAPRAGQAGDLRRRAFLRRLARRPRTTRSSACEQRSPRAPRTSRSATPTAPVCRPRSALRRRPWSRSSASGSRSASTPTTTSSAGSPTRSPRSTAGARMVQATINGYGERCGNANLVSILAALQLKLGYECVPADRLRLLTETAHFVDELHEHRPGPRPALRRAQRVRAQGRHARRRRSSRRAHLRAHGPEAGRQQPRRADLRALGQGLGALAGRGRRDRRSMPMPPSERSSGSRSASTAAITTRPPMPRSTCCCAARPASISRCSGSRASA